MKNRLLDFSSKFSNLTGIKSIRNGLVSMIPVLIIGAFALIIKEFPVKGYQNFITSFGDGFIKEFFNFIFSATFGVLSVYLTFSISRAYMKIKGDPDAVHGGAIFASIICFFILTGSNLESFNLDKMGPKSMFLGIIASLGASSLYIIFFHFFNIRKKIILSAGADRELNRMLSTFFPILMVVITYTLANFIIITIFSKASFHDLYISVLNKIFSRGEAGFAKGFFFVLLSSVLWFFGVHGSDALEGVMETFFTPGLATNQALVEAGSTPNVILTKEFFDCFVLMGGCGATICLLLAILIFSKNRARKGLGLTASFPMIFNINELMVFGLPIIYSPIMLIPFLLVPLVCFSVSYLAISTGLVPVITSSVVWTTPVFLGGYLATGSIAGSLLQLVNIIIGTAIYFPFIRILDKASDRSIQENYERFMVYFKENEQTLNQRKLTDLNNIYGDFAKDLCADLKHDLYKNLNVYYQPQYSYDGKCIGVEALLRWIHPVHGMIYPPLVLKLAGECGLLNKLETKIIDIAISDKEKIDEKYGKVKLSINITGTGIISTELLDFIGEKTKTYDFKDNQICLEITEQAALALNDDTYNILKQIKEYGLVLAIDDFSMGQTSIQYLKYNIFDIIKIDGSLVKGLNISSNCKEIIQSITDLSQQLSMVVIAEYVETEEEKEMLHQIGCNNYQGFLFSEAKKLDE